LVDVTLAGVQRLPPTLDAVDHDTPVLAPTLPPRPPSGGPLVLSKPSVVSALLAWRAVHAQRP